MQKKHLKVDNSKSNDLTSQTIRTMIPKDKKRKILVTGAAGFIGSALTIRLLDRGDQVIGIDNHNDYYDPALKEARLSRHANHENYTHLRIDIADRQVME